VIELDVETLPDGWRLVQIGDVVATVQAGFASGARDENGAIQLRMNNVNTTGHIDWKEFIRVPTDTALLARYTLEPGDVVFNNTNSTELVGKSALFLGHTEPVVYSNHFTRMRVQSDSCDPLFFCFWLNHLWQKQIFRNICDRWIGQSAVKFDKLSALPIFLPTLLEQQRIAQLLKTKLAAVERARQASAARLDAARALPAAYLREVFESEDAINWPISTLGDLAQVIGGMQKTPHRAPNKHSRPYLTVRNVQRGYLDLTAVERFEVTPREVERYRLEDEDLLIVEGNGSRDHIGRNALFIADGQEWVHQNHVIRVRLDRDLCSPQFVSAYLNSDGGKQQMLEKAETTSGLYTLSTGKVNNLLVPLPPLPEQKRLATLLAVRRKSTETAEELINKQYTGIATLSGAILRQAFSGAL
jgi:type I restriction enzyme S subunit